MKQKWIRVEDELPEHRRAVLVYSPFMDSIYCADYQAEYDDDGLRTVGRWYICGDCIFSEVPEKVSHWMQLPDAPEMQNGEL